MKYPFFLLLLYVYLQNGKNNKKEKKKRLGKKEAPHKTSRDSILQ